MSPKPPSEIVRFEQDGAIARLIIDNPAARNGLTAEACRDMAGFLDRAGDDASVRAIVVTGAGGHFSAGADLRASAAVLQGTDEQVMDYVRAGFHTVIEALFRCHKPTLAVIRGACVGFSFDMALACDLRLCASDAKFGQVFARIGLVPDGGSSFSLPRLVGLGKAMEIMLLAETFDGARAEALGLVNRAVAPEALDALAEDWAARLAAGPPIAFRLGKANLRAGAAGGTLEAALQREAEAQLQCLRSKDSMRGVQAFFRKQPPGFQGD